MAELAARIEALRARGAQRADPVRLSLIEALARRAQGQDGAVRRALEARLAQLVAACAEALERPQAGKTDAEAPAVRGPLGHLVDSLARGDTAVTAGPAAKAAAASVPRRTARPELEALPYFRRTWSKLSVEQRLAESRSALPDNAGPLNSHHLVHRSLTLMREVSPEYLERFVTQVDALLWLEAARKGG